MLVKFLSSETGELIMFSEAAGPLLRAIDKECTARGTFTREQMLPAATLLRQAVARGEGTLPEEDKADGSEKPVAMGARAWPLPSPDRPPDTDHLTTTAKEPSSPPPPR